MKVTIKVLSPVSLATDKMADVELHFHEPPLAGMKLIGFAVWEQASGKRNVTFPGRQYMVNGEKRSFALLRVVTDSAHASVIRQLILDAYDQWDGDTDPGDSEAPEES
jgi:hypothetical protein